MSLLSSAAPIQSVALSVSGLSEGINSEKVGHPKRILNICSGTKAVRSALVSSELNRPIRTRSANWRADCSVECVREMVMKVSERINLIDTISRELQSRYSFTEIDTYLAAFSIDPPQNVSVNSKRIYSATALKRAQLNTILQIADDLGIESKSHGPILHPLPANWVHTKELRVFISHISKDKQKATRLKEALSGYAINGFVAHEDILPTLEWQMEIERALGNMDVFVSIHTAGFSNSNWTQQEIGYAVARGVKIISLRMGEDPTGFISRRQALPRLQKNANQIAQEIEALILTDPRTKPLLEAAQRFQAQALSEDIPF